jgi:hypothetical protein
MSAYVSIRPLRALAPRLLSHTCLARRLPVCVCVCACVCCVCVYTNTPANAGAQYRPPTCWLPSLAASAGATPHAAMRQTVYWPKLRQYLFFCTRKASALSICLPPQRQYLFFCTRKASVFVLLYKESECTQYLPSTCHLSSAAL